MSRKMSKQTWFIADTHFGHPSILNFTKRPFDDLKHMENGLVKRWNSKVKKNDLVYILGDFIWNTVKPQEYRRIMSRLNGEKILIIGNHDRMKEISALNYGFRCAMREAKIRVGEHYLLLSHYPYRWGFWRSLKSNLKRLLGFQKYKIKHHHLRPKDEGGWLIHGHSHQQDILRGKSIHVGVDSWNCYPVSLNKIMEIIKNNS